MNITQTDNEVKISEISDFDLKKTFECGQCFRWNCDKDGQYTGVAFGRVAGLRQDGNDVYITGSIEEFNNLWRNYFDIDRNYESVRKRVCINEFMMNATNFGKGIRILHQDPWETLCSFILSPVNNIPRIKSSIETLCRVFGDCINYNNQKFYTFPAPDILAKLSPDNLAPLRCGWRAKNIIIAARAVTYNQINLNEIGQLSESEITDKLKILPGVGDKVAACVSLFGFHKLDAFPVDTWISKALKHHFEPGFDPSVFSPYRGIAQQYIFYYTRNGIKT